MWFPLTKVLPTTIVLKTISLSINPQTPISQELKIEAHITNIVNKASSKLGFMKHNLKGCPEELEQQAYFALVCSGLAYTGTVWSPVLKQDIDKVEKIQRNAARIVKGEYRIGLEISVTTMIDELTRKSLQERRKNAHLCILFRAANGEVALQFDQLVKADSCTRSGKRN